FDLGHNLSSDASCQFTSPGSLNNTDPKLGPLDNYGGPTPAMPLLAGSPAIDGGDSSVFLPTDQRGRTRPYGAAPDIGAFESSPPFVLRGLISGFTFRSEISVSAGAAAVSTTNQGRYSLEGLAAGTYAVAPDPANYLCLPSSRSVTVGPDQVGVDFKAYQWNALSLEDATNRLMHLVFAGTQGQTYRVLESIDLVGWLPVATNTIGPSNYFEVFVPMSSAGAHLFRTVTP
ncbi:MAG TPA: choice-of-anchor Q domain-containing protein, partial [Candidatus Sulfotelmatobacter sp.]|nr:choice-of-anchor Q domain-containing protein [Candidatus Sulfotelmatobacter sp.]